MVQWLRLPVSNAGAQVQSLVWGPKTYMLHGVAKIK